VTKMHLFFGAYLELENLPNAAPRKINPQVRLYYARIYTILWYILDTTSAAFVYILFFSYITMYKTESINAPICKDRAPSPNRCPRSAAERRGNNLKRFKDFYLRVKARFLFT